MTKILVVEDDAANTIACIQYPKTRNGRGLRGGDVDAVLVEQCRDDLADPGRVVDHEDLEPLRAIDPRALDADAPPPVPAITETTAIAGIAIDDKSRQSNQQRHEVVFIDAGAPNYRQLIDDLTKASDAGRNIEIIVIDDGSTDGTAAAIQDWSNGQSDIHLRLIIFA